MQSINPCSGEPAESYQEHTPSQVERILAAAHSAFAAWSQTSYEERSSVLREVAQLLRREAGELADLMAREMGKPVAQGRAEADKCAWVCDYYAENAADFLAPERIRTDASQSYVTFKPLGVILAVMPWNFPLWQVFRCAAPALMAGNVCVLKHASNVPGSALAIESLFQRVRSPGTPFAACLVGGSRVEAMVRDDRIRAVALTGSAPAGRAVARAAGESLKKCVLELGGSDPYIVFADADLDLAVEVCVTSRLINSGQSCIAAKRFILVDPIAGTFTESFVSAMSRARMGDPLRDDVDLGPLARHDLRDELHQQVRASIDKGASLLLGGEIPDGPGAFYPPTVLSDVQPGMPAFDEELFGPVAAIVRVADEEEAIRMANTTSFGLGAALFTRDIRRGESALAQRVESGSCFLNTYVRSDPRLPFGGIKESGYGRELGEYGIKEFVNIKTVYIA